MAKQLSLLLFGFISCLTEPELGCPTNRINSVQIATQEAVFSRCTLLQTFYELTPDRGCVKYLCGRTKVNRRRYDDANLVARPVKQLAVHIKCKKKNLISLKEKFDVLKENKLKTF